MSGAQTACRALFGTCSEDRVTVYHGAAEPAKLCGRHAAYIQPGDYARMREAGTIR